MTFAFSYVVGSDRQLYLTLVLIVLLFHIILSRSFAGFVDGLVVWLVARPYLSIPRMGGVSVAVAIGVGLVSSFIQSLGMSLVTRLKIISDVPLHHILI